MQNKKYLVITAIVLVVVAVAALVLRKINTGPQTNQPPTNEPKPAIETVNIDSAKLPANMPADLPFEKDARIVGNHEVTDSKTGNYQSDRSYVTAKTIQENLTIYKSYLEKNGWKILNTLDQPNYKMLSAENNFGHLDIMLNYSSGTKDNLVSVYYTYKPLSSS